MNVKLTLPEERLFITENILRTFFASWVERKINEIIFKLI